MQFHLRHLHKSDPRAGMTLIELVVVLALMAGLATLMLSGASDLANQGRYDETITRMRLIREAVVGNGAEAGRFVRDMGRLPVVQSTNYGAVLSEFWARGAAPAFDNVWSENLLDGSGSMNWPESLSGLLQSNSVHCGWNGPYLVVNNSSDAEIYDGFGNDFLAAKAVSADPDTESHWYNAPGVSGHPNIGDKIYGVLSRGSDGTFAKNSWDEANRPVAFKSPLTTLEVLVKAKDTSAAQSIWRQLVACPERQNGMVVATGDVVLAEYDLNTITERSNSELINYGVCRKLPATEELFISTTTPSGMTDSSLPSGMADTPYGQTVTDGSVVWRRLDAAEKRVFRCKDTGSSTHETDTQMPGWAVVEVGDETVDNDITWTYVGLVSELHQYVNRLRVALFIPAVAQDAVDVGWVMAELDDNNVQPTVTLPEDSTDVVPIGAAITPGVRKIYAYGFLDGQTEPLTSGEEPEMIELHPGHNFITLYLR